jgi:hypothetical protein
VPPVPIQNPQQYIASHMAFPNKIIYRFLNLLEAHHRIYTVSKEREVNSGKVFSGHQPGIRNPVPLDTGIF